MFPFCHMWMFVKYYSLMFWWLFASKWSMNATSNGRETLGRYKEKTLNTRSEETRRNICRTELLDPYREAIKKWTVLTNETRRMIKQTTTTRQANKIRETSEIKGQSSENHSRGFQFLLSNQITARALTSHRRCHFSEGAMTIRHVAKQRLRGIPSANWIFGHRIDVLSSPITTAKV